VKSHFNTDKIWQHGYFPAYITLAATLGPKAKVCEFGVRNGESLRMWQSLFPLGEVTGVDIDSSSVFPKDTKRVICRQDDPELARLGPFDLIVDDASHDGMLTRKTFEIMWPRVRPGGFYVVEDWFIGLGRYVDKAYDPAMLETVRDFLLLLTADSDMESASFRYGLAIARKKACA
jgi:predicted O-methyltransferase YrrM